MINITNSSLAAHAQSSGNDILFTASDGTTVLSYEREAYTNGTGALVAWVNVPLVSHTADTVLYMYYGNSSASDQQNKTAVWDSNYQGVWHLNQTPTGTAGDIADSTSLANNGTSQTIAAGAQVAGKIDGSLTLDGTSDYISTATAFTPATTSSETVQAWVKTTYAAGTKVVGLEINQTGTGSATADRQIYVDTGGYARFGTWNTTPGNANIAVSTSKVNDGNWHYLVGVRDNSTSTVYLYVDGVLQPTTPSSGGQTYTGYWRIGSYHITGGAGQWTNGASGYFNGSVDEVRVSQIARSADWIATEYNNENSPPTFYSLGAATPVSLGNNTQFTQSPAFGESFTMPSGGAVSVRSYASVPSGTLSANPGITATLSFATTTFASLGNPIATLTGGGSETISAVAGATTNFSRSTSVTNWTNSYNSGATGANRILMVGISYLNKTNGLEISSVTYNALPLTQVGTATNFMNGRIYIFSLLNPPTGANDLVVNWTAAQTNGAVVGAVTYAGVEQATPTGFVSATNRSTTPSVTVASGTGQLVFGVVDGGSTSTYTTTGTELWSALAYSAAPLAPDNPRRGQPA